MGHTKRIATYLRVSTDKQSVDSQKHALKAYIARQEGWKHTAEYTDIESALKSRPGRNELMEDVLRRKFDIVCVYRFDRFARSLKDLIESLNFFQENNIDFISVSENIDTTTPAGRLMFHMIGAMAEFERNLLSERVKAGMRAAEAKGRKAGRPLVDVDIKEMKKLKAEGLSLRQISRRVGISPASIYRIEKREAEKN